MNREVEERFLAMHVYYDVWNDIRHSVRDECYSRIAGVSGGSTLASRHAGTRLHTSRFNIVTNQIDNLVDRIIDTIP